LGKHIKSASPEELKKQGLVQGFISPVGMKGNPLPFIADHSIKDVKNFVTGANEPAKDYVNVNVGRDFTVEDFTDLVSVEKGFKCSKCGHELGEVKAIEAGNIFKLGTKYSEDFDLYFMDEDGKNKPVVMGCYGIGNTRLLGTVVEALSDDKGIIWPKSIAPYQVHIVRIGPEDETVNAADKLYDDLVKEGAEVLYDDRDESAGKKLNDADLIGVPLRLVVSSRNLKGDSVEWKVRSEKDGKQVKVNEVVKEVKKWVKK
jgi:prolyl-tRNA synthetase